VHIPGAELSYSAADKEALVEVYWPNMQTYYQGVIKEFRDVGDEDDAGHSGLKIVYTDGDVRWCVSARAAVRACPRRCCQCTSASASLSALHCAAASWRCQVHCGGDAAAEAPRAPVREPVHPGQGLRGRRRARGPSAAGDCEPASRQRAAADGLLRHLRLRGLVP
jgi:hypothetical protein